MKSSLPHFGTVTSLICDCLNLGETQDAKSKTAVLSERTGRTIAAGQPVKDKTWDEYAAELVDAITAFPIFPLLGKDCSKLTASFHSYRQSYELLNSTLGGLPARSDSIQRAVLRLTILDFGIRYAALCVAEGTSPSKGSPQWTHPDGGNQFWRRTMEIHFPGVTLVGSRDEDCANRLQMHPSKFKRCLYENDFPGIVVLRRLFPDGHELANSMRHYAAYRLCRQLADAFSQAELDDWINNWQSVGDWLHGILVKLVPMLPEPKRAIFLTNVFTGGISGKMFSGLLKEKLADRIPARFKDDLLAIANNDPMQAINHYVEFCNYVGDTVRGGCWETAFLSHREDFEHFNRTGKFPDAQKPSSRLTLAWMHGRAADANDQPLQEKILRHIINEYPDDAEARQLLGQLCEVAGRKEEAWQWFEQAHKTNPDFILPLFSLADSKSRAGLHPEAVSIASAIPPTGLGPGSQPYLNGICQVRAGNFRKAMSLLESAFSSGWKPGESAALLALCCEREQPPRPETAKAVRKWTKEARHRGFEIEQVSKSILL